MSADRIDNPGEKLAIRISVITIIINFMLSALKFTAGILAGSAAMISDAVHSASDVLSTFAVIAGVKIAGRQADESHPYGHERFECVASLVLAVILCLTGLGIGWNSLKTVLMGDSTNLPMPGILALIAAVVSIIVKEAMYWYTRNGAKKINSGALMADAWHHRSDALSSVGSFIGILGARMGYPLLDPLAGVVICMFIVKASYDIFMDSISRLTDNSCDDETVEGMRKLILNHEDVYAVDDIKTRIFGSRIYVDIEICADGEQSLQSAHAVAEKVHDAIEAGFPDVKHCMVHVNPCKAKAV